MRTSRIVVIAFAAVAAFMLSESAGAYDRYQDGCNNAGCHGDFTGSTTTKGSVFPSGDKHAMHRGASNMNTECDLCHTSGDGRNPFIGSSTGTASNVGYGCVGCHGRLEDTGNDGGFASSPGRGAGLRQHHHNNSVTSCAACHSDANPANYTPVGEQFRPPYYGSVDTNAANACNPTQAANTNENWTIGEFVGLDNDGDNVYDGSDTDCPAPAKTAGDFKFDGKADILWRNTATGKNWLYSMSGSVVEDSSGINTVSTTWNIVGTGDYDGNGTADVLWRNSSTGKNWMYLMAGPRVFQSTSVNTVSDLQWEVVGNGDYNGDGKSDILWRHASTGKNWMYLMDGPTVITSAGVNTVSDSAWKVVGSGDYNGDGNSDILWRNTSTGKNWVYLMNGTDVQTSAGINTIADQRWRIVGSGDYNNDGNSDILWRQDGVGGSGSNFMYLMDGATVIDSGGVRLLADLAWMVAGSGDYDGDGDSDILWRNTSTGHNYIYVMDGLTRVDTLRINIVSAVSPGWEIVDVD